mmetsp:Transcript_5642/g.12255  ORF Transcript_5642/g.12255 Transcript_5642/m.12255 type:complete len:118 (-) Transcript_5642:430-783(-)
MPTCKEDARSLPLPPTTMLKPCSNPHCPRPTNVVTHRCGACRCARYCSKECQLAMWPKHKEECGKEREEEVVEEEKENAGRPSESETTIIDPSWWWSGLCTGIFVAGSCLLSRWWYT